MSKNLDVCKWLEELGFQICISASTRKDTFIKSNCQVDVYFNNQIVIKHFDSPKPLYEGELPESLEKLTNLLIGCVMGQYFEENPDLLKKVLGFQWI